jgi:hypothetical protein
MRGRHLVPFLVCAACGAGSVSGDDDDTGDDDGGGPDAASFDGEPPGLEGTVDAHNAERASHGLTALAWDPALAATAQAWAEQCVDTMAPIGLIDHNPNRSAGHSEYVGENIYGSGGAQATGVAAVAAWISEEEDYDYASNTCNGVCGHWTQVVWATTERVGCGIHTCPGLQYCSSIVCNYGPGGNDGNRPF